MGRRKIEYWYGPIVICLLGLIIYSNTFHSPFYLDDWINVVHNRAIRNLGNLSTIFDFCPTRFVTYLSFSLNYHFHGGAVFGYHLVNIAIHIAASILLFWFILLIFSTPYFTPHLSSDPPTIKVGGSEGDLGVRNILALFGSLLFVCHPLQTQAVTYIVQRAASLATLFYLLSLCLYIKSNPQNVGVGFIRPAGLMNQAPTAWGTLIGYYWTSVLAGLLAMFTKEIAVTLPFILLLYEFCFFPKGHCESGMRSNPEIATPFGLAMTKWKRLAPFFVALLITLVTIKLTGSVDFAQLRQLNQTAILSPLHYLFTQLRVIVTYLRLLLVPINQNLDYDYPIAKNLFNLPVFASFTLLLVILATGFILFRKYRLLSFGIFWFFLTILPESSIIPIRDVIFEHRLYLPMVGYSIFLPALGYYFFPRRFLRFLPVILTAAVAIYGVSAYQRNRVWQNELALWSDTVSKSPNKARPYNNRGILYLSRGKYEQALADFNRAVMIAPDYADAYLNRGELYHEKGDYEQALADFTQALKIAPGYAKAFCNRGVIYENRGEYEKALTEYTQAIKLDRNYVQVYFNRGNVYLNQREFDKAIADYTRAITLTPTNAAAYNNRGFAYFLKNDYTRARQDLNQAKTLGYQVHPELFKILNQNAK